MTLPCPWTVALLVCFCSSIGARTFSAYDKKLELLSSIVKKDYLWRQIFLESIYFKLDRTYYQRIIDDELLIHARYEEPAAVPPVAGQSEASGEEKTSDVVPPQTDTRDRIIPYEFVRNIMVNRFVVGSILDMGLEVLMVSFKCLMYKHMVHLSNLIQVEMTRGNNKDNHDKAASWSKKSIELLESILMTMGALQFTDIYVLDTLSFFDIYKSNSKKMSPVMKAEYIAQMTMRSDLMIGYVKENCVVKPKEDKKESQKKQIAKMLGVVVHESLYDTSSSFAITKDEYKKMVVSSREKISAIFGTTPRINGMSETMWNGILHYEENSKENY